MSRNEGEGGVVRFTLNKTRGAVGDVSVRLFTVDDSAMGESLHHYINIKTSFPPSSICGDRF